MFEIVHNEKVLKNEHVQEILWSVHAENASGWPEDVCGQQTYFVWIVGLFFKNVFFLFDPTFKNKKTLCKIRISNFSGKIQKSGNSELKQQALVYGLPPPFVTLEFTD